LLCGAILGSYLARNPLIFRTSQFSLKLAVWGALLIFLFAVIKSVENNTVNETHKYWAESIGLISLRVGFVLLLNSIVSFISLKMISIPKMFVLIGRNTLLIYIAHLIILYGSAWSPGLILLFDRNLSAWVTVATAFLMIVTMTIMVIMIHRLKIRNKEVIT
jgi:fucose 4-O-acetylase-like acetyltransferase